MHSEASKLRKTDFSTTHDWIVHTFKGKIGSSKKKGTDGESGKIDGKEKSNHIKRKGGKNGPRLLAKVEF